MRFIRKSLVLIILIPNIILLNVSLNTSDNYGPYTVTFGSFQLCSGPRRYNGSKIDARFVSTGNSKIIVLNVTNFDNAQIHEIRTIVYSIKGKSRSTLWDYRWRDPCRYYAVSNLLQLYGVKNCVMEKGVFEIKVNVTTVLDILLGKSFFYGEFLIKSIAISKKVNLFCSATNVIFKKKI